MSLASLAYKSSLVAAVIVVMSGGARAAKITEIVVADNNKTETATVLYLANIDEGDEWNDNLQETVRLELISSGLFKDVTVFSEVHPEGGIKVTILAVDKHSWVVAPTYYNQPTNRGGGAGFGENNLFGQNKKLLLYGQVATGDSFFVAAYIDPSIAETPFHWQFDTYLANRRIFEYSTPRKWWRGDSTPVRETKLRYLNAGAKIGVTILRSLSLDGRLRGARVFYGNPKLVGNATEEDVGVTAGDAIPKPGAAGWDVSWKASLGLDGRANYFGITTGSKFEVAWEKSLLSLGSDFRYWVGSMSLQKGVRLLETHNLVLKARGSMGKDLPFQQERTAGGTSLRGYQNDQFRGDLAVAGNIEYSMHLFSFPFPLLERIAIRGLGFYDGSYTRFSDIDDTDDFRNYLPGQQAMGSKGLRNSVGGGVRFYTRAIVLPLLGLDVGYGLETGGVEIWFAIGLTD